MLRCTRSEPDQPGYAAKISHIVCQSLAHSEHHIKPCKRLGAHREAGREVAGAALALGRQRLVLGCAGEQETCAGRRQTVQRRWAPRAAAHEQPRLRLVVLIVIIVIYYVCSKDTFVF